MPRMQSLSFAKTRFISIVGAFLFFGLGPASCGGGGSASTNAIAVTAPIAQPVSPPTGAELAGEVLSAGWSRAYLAGSNDSSGNYMGGSQVMHLVPRNGSLFAAVGYWLDSISPAYGGTNANFGAATGDR